MTSHDIFHKWKAMCHWRTGSAHTWCHIVDTHACMGIFFFILFCLQGARVCRARVAVLLKSPHWPTTTIDVCEHHPKGEGVPSSGRGTALPCLLLDKLYILPPSAVMRNSCALSEGLGWKRVLLWGTVYVLAVKCDIIENRGRWLVDGIRRHPSSVCLLQCKMRTSQIMSEENI